MKHILVVHGINHEADDNTFKQHVYNMFKPHIKDFDVAVMNSRSENLYRMIEHAIDEDEKIIRITPLTFFSTIELDDIIPELINTFNHTHPWVKISCAQPIARTKYLTKIIENLIPSGKPEQTLVAVIGLGHENFQTPNDELMQFISQFDHLKLKMNGFMLNGTMDYSVLLPNSSRRFDRVVVIPLFFLHNKVHSDMQQTLSEICENKIMDVLPSFTESTALKQLIIQNIKDFENSRIYI